MLLQVLVLHAADKTRLGQIVERTTQGKGMMKRDSNDFCSVYLQVEGDSIAGRDGRIHEGDQILQVSTNLVPSVR